MFIGDTDDETESESELDYPYLISDERWKEITDKMREEDAEWKKELKKEKDREYYHKNKTKIMANVTKWCKNNVDRNRRNKRESASRAYLRNGEKIREHGRRWRIANRDLFNEINRNHKKEHYKCRTCKLFYIRQRGQECATCGGHRCNSAEYELRDYIKEWYPDAVLDKIIEGSCLRYRPDIFIETSWGCLIVEVDEQEHRDYDPNCEVVREFNIHQALGCDLTIVRYNPDSYKPDGVNTQRLTKEERMGALFLALQEACETHRAGLHVEYLFYSPDRIAELNGARSNLPK
jgi:hypothetical protein